MTVTNAWVRLSPVQGRPAAGYFTATTANEPEAIVAISAPPPTRIEMHESMEGGATASMRPIPSAPLAAGEPLAFTPGGKHLMLFDVDPAVNPGDKLPLTFRFAKAPPVTVEAEVVAAGSEPSHGGH